MADADLKETELLLSALFEGGLSEVDSRKLEALIKNDKQARELYLDYCEMHALLQWEHGVLGAGAKTPEVLPQPAAEPRPRRWLIWAPLAVAALLALALIPASPVAPQPSVAEEAQPELLAGEFVARVTGSKDCKLVGTAVSFQTGDVLRQGQRIELASGFAEITFDSGAQVLLEGPASLDVNSAWEAALRKGTLKASVPSEAIGFRISSPSVDVVDLGTEFSMIAEESGATEVFVLKGAVQAAPVLASAAAPQKILLKEAEARRFAKTGTSEVTDRERKARRFARAIALERFSGPTDFVHWSFDENGGKVAHAKTVGSTKGEFDAHFKNVSDPAGLRTSGRFGKALNCNGEVFSKIPFSGSAAKTARSFAFWVKLPADSLLSDGDTMLAWSRRDKKRGNARALQIGWNSNAAQGALGTLRTELGRAFVTGSTPLRDGKWHHVVITLAPGRKPAEGMHVSQYVDGRLDGITSVRHKDRRIEVNDSDDISEMLFLGSSVRPQLENKFRGELDELYIVERALTPQEIQQLMSANTLSARELAAQ